MPAPQFVVVHNSDGERVDGPNAANLGAAGGSNA